MMMLLIVLLLELCALFGCDRWVLVQPMVGTPVSDAIEDPGSVLLDPSLILLLYECKILHVATCSDIGNLVIVLVQHVEQLITCC